MKTKILNSFLAMTVLGIATVSLLTACDHGPWEDDHYDHGGQGDGSVIIIDPGRSSEDQNPVECEAVSASTYYFSEDSQYSTQSSSSYHCYEKDPYRFTTSCAANDCSQVAVYVHYGLKEDLGENFRVHIEAFDNPNFNGYPIGKVEINRFKAEPGYWKDTEIWLPEGSYYLRAFLSNDESPNMPYQMGDMVLIQDQPVGVFGVLSGAEVVQVDYRRKYTKPVSIHLDQLFKKPGSEPDTNARLRSVVKFPDGVELQAGKEVKIEIHDSIDFEAVPVAAMVIKSELFMIQGQAGKAEIVSQSMQPGSYFVRIYYDLNQNGFFDEGELQAVHGGFDTPERVSVEKDHTRSLTLTLSAG